VARDGAWALKGPSKNPLEQEYCQHKRHNIKRAYEQG